MNIRKDIYIGIIGLLLTFFLYGCAGYGKITANPVGDKMTINELLKNQQNYDVSYAGWTNSIPPCFIFDPKDDDRKLIGETWYKSENPEWVSDRISWIRPFSRAFPRLQRISGPDDRFYGFLYCDSDYRTVAKVVDENTMYLFNPVTVSTDEIF